ncbi:MAG: hypothetical protein PHV16_00465 [Candidatus Nanoarchaeia archaeon]|nr:hypothetical protein [Candidatus Nanoarchaeia archaeon]
MIKKISAMFAIMLILVLPVYSASVFASINNIGVFGDNNFNGFRKEDDVTFVIANVSISGDNDIGPQQVFFNENQRFTGCEASGDYFTCILGLNKNTLKPDTYKFTIRLKDDLGRTVDYQEESYVVDSRAPLITAFSVLPKVTKKGNFTVQYDIRDYSYGTTPGSCIDKIIICKDDLSNIIQEIKMNGASCLDSKKIELKTSDFVSSTGSADICIIAYDMLGQASEMKCEKLTVDEKSPDIKTDSFKITNTDGSEIGYVSTEAKSAIIYIEVEEELISKVNADLSELNSESSYKSRDAECIKKDDVYECRWPVTIKLSESEKANIKIKAEDSVGNSAEKTVTHAFKFDKNSPVVKSISNEEGTGEIISKNTNLVSNVEEKESGLSLENVWVNIGNNKLKADKCVQEGDSWNCYFNDLVLNAADGSPVVVSVSPDSKDDIGNKFDLTKGVSSETFVIDSKAPYLLSRIEIKRIDNQTYPVEDFVSGDRLNIKAALNERTDLTASADLSAIGFGEEEKGSCSKEGEYWICEWNTAPIPSGPIKGNLNFKFSDVVGNSLTESVPINVIGLDYEENPDYWYVERIDKSPNAIDRQTAALITHKEYVHVFLEPIYDCGTSILAMDLECSGDTNYIQGYELINKNSEDPYITITLNQQEMPENSLSLKCNLLLISRICGGDTIAANVEEQPVEFTVDFYNMPLGEISDNVKNKIREAQDSWLVEQEWLGELDKWITWAERICGLLDTWGKVNQALSDIEGLLDVLSFSFIGQATKESFKEFLVTSDNWHQKVIDSQYNLCKYISCDKTLWGDWYTDIIGKNSKALGESGFVATIWPQNPKDSIVLSLATGCLPGIVHNLQKRRQIECYYILCLKNAAVEGVPFYSCDAQKSYLECMFIYGEIFQIIPFAGFFKNLAGHIETIFSDPLGMIFAGLNFFCDMQRPGKPHAGCILAHLVPTLAEITEDIAGLFDTKSWQVGDVCEEALKSVDDLTKNIGSSESEDETSEDSSETTQEGQGQTTEEGEEQGENE